MTRGNDVEIYVCVTNLRQQMSRENSYTILSLFSSNLMRNGYRFYIIGAKEKHTLRMGYFNKV